MKCTILSVGCSMRTMKCCVVDVGHIGQGAVNSFTRYLLVPLPIRTCCDDFGINRQMVLVPVHAYSKASVTHHFAVRPVVVTI